MPAAELQDASHAASLSLALQNLEQDDVTHNDQVGVDSSRKRVHRRHDPAVGSSRSRPTYRRRSFRRRQAARRAARSRRDCRSSQYHRARRSPAPVVARPISARRPSSTAAFLVVLPVAFIASASNSSSMSILVRIAASMCMVESKYTHRASPSSSAPRQIRQQSGRHATAATLSSRPRSAPAPRPLTRAMASGCASCQAARRPSTSPVPEPGRRR